MVKGKGTQMTSKKALRARYSQIVKELSDLSRKGWAFAKPVDYLPLEREQRQLAEMLFGPSPKLTPVKIKERN